MTVLSDCDRAHIETALAGRIVRCVGMGDGVNAALSGLILADGRRMVAKRALSNRAARLDLEAAMLRTLAVHAPALPIPRVHIGTVDLLVMDWMPGGEGLTTAAEEHLAELLVGLHAVQADTYGLGWDTVIGPLVQANPPTLDWLVFFRDHRLLPMAELVVREGRLPVSLRRRIDQLAARLPSWLEAASPPSLIHGDLWSGNIISKNGRVTGVIDPAIYYADPEMELAFGTLFGTFGDAFFRRYHEHRPIQPGFFEVRRDLYTLYPLLVHVHLFGGAYVVAVQRIVDRYVG